MKNTKHSPLTVEQFCPIRQTIRLLGKRWTILIIKEIYFEKNRKLSFMQLKRRLMNVSTKVLSERLKEMVKEGMIKRKVLADKTPIQVEYSLTKKGKDACEIIQAFKEYGLKWGEKDTIKCSNMDCELCRKNMEE